MFTLHGAHIGTPGEMSPKKGETNTRERGRAARQTRAKGPQTYLDSPTDNTYESA
jgi:hypothetical protein